MHQHNYIRGMRQGIPVGLGYFVVSFTIGIAARKADLTPVQAAVMSFTNNTSAGQFASDRFGGSLPGDGSLPGSDQSAILSHVLRPVAEIG